MLKNFWTKGVKHNGHSKHYLQINICFFVDDISSLQKHIKKKTPTSVIRQNLHFIFLQKLQINISSGIYFRPQLHWTKQ